MKYFAVCVCRSCKKEFKVPLETAMHSEIVRAVEKNIPINANGYFHYCIEGTIMKMGLGEIIELIMEEN